MQQEAQNRERGEQSSQRYSEQRSSGGWGHSGGGGGGGEGEVVAGEDSNRLRKFLKNPTTEAGFLHSVARYPPQRSCPVVMRIEYFRLQ